MCDEFNLHATLALGVGPPELWLIAAVGTLCTVIHYQTAFAVSTAPGTESAGCILSQGLSLSELEALPPPPPLLPLDVFLRDNPLGPALIRDVIVVIICHICK